MQLSTNQLDIHLNKNLLPLYLISGDELLCVQEARDDIVRVATSQGFAEKKIIDIGAQFNTDTLLNALQNQSLFSEKIIIDIRNPSGKFDATTTTILQNYLSNARSDLIIIISTNKLSVAAQKSIWFDSIQKKGGYIPIWPIKINALPQWIMARAKKYHVKMSDENAQLLAHFCEGNLLAAQQALEKINLLYSDKAITEREIRSVVSDHAHFSIFDLSDAISQKNIKKSLRILKKLEQSGEEPALVLWAICRQLRTHNTLFTRNALQSAAHADEILKGGKTGDIWLALSSIITEQ